MGLACKNLRPVSISSLGCNAALALLVLSSLSLVDLSWSLDNGLAMTPPLGWSSWVAVGELDFCDEQSLKESADALVSTGMAEAGYKTLMISDCWGALERDSKGNLQANSTRFPSGTLKPIIDYIHSKGLKAGVYQDIGTGTCNKHLAGMYGHYEQDAQLLANEWHIDWIKVSSERKTTSSCFFMLGHVIQLTPRIPLSQKRQSHSSPAEVVFRERLPGLHPFVLTRNRLGTVGLFLVQFHLM